MFLKREEIEQLTARKKPGAQAAALRAMRIAHFIDADGRPVVLRETLLSGAAAPPPAKNNDCGLDLSGVR